MNTPPKPPMPEQPKTKEIPRVVVPLQNATLDEVLVAVRRLTTSQDAIISAQLHTTDLVLDLSQKVDGFEERLTKHSDRARVPSEHDLAAAAALAQESAAREALAKRVESIDAKQDLQLEIMQDLRKVAAHPLVRKLAYAAAAAAITYLAANGH